MNETLKKALREHFKQAQNCLIMSHMRPDGDAVGSVLGLGLALQDAGKEVQMVLADGVPTSFRHLSGSQQIRRKAQGNFDLVIVVDCSDPDRVGERLQKHLPPHINIDHHITNTNFAELNWVDASATATTEMLTEFLPELGLEIRKPAAEALLTGLITDTLGFRTANMRPNALRMAAWLYDLGADLPGLYQKALLERSFNAARYWGRGLDNLQVEGRLLWTTLTLEDRQAVDYPGKDDADLVNYLTTIKDADVYVIFIEQNADSVKVSWRAKPGFDVSRIATHFGGGGHKPAAGAEIDGPLDEVKTAVLELTRELLNGSE
ncbi:MAG: bifunctional oligoribonuclease/PAP phosphatase NrnA [Anaerolineales bacterium]|nr:bifunctional oligoribonuclease/PAP phosphatase NrnA [Anaerolineales bacterium]